MATNENQPLVNIAIAILIGLAVYLTGSWLMGGGGLKITAESILDDVIPPDEMLEHAKEYDQPMIIKVSHSITLC